MNICYPRATLFVESRKAAMRVLTEFLAQKRRAFSPRVGGSSPSGPTPKFLRWRHFRPSGGPSRLQHLMGYSHHHPAGTGEA